MFAALTAAGSYPGTAAVSGTVDAGLDWYRGPGGGPAPGLTSGGGGPPG